jgi:hypothetical protein
LSPRPSGFAALDPSASGGGSPGKPADGPFLGGPRNPLDLGVRGDASATITNIAGPYLLRYAQEASWRIIVACQTAIRPHTIAALAMKGRQVG